MTEYPGALRVLATKTRSLLEQAEKEHIECQHLLTEPPPTTSFNQWISEKRTTQDQFACVVEKLEAALDKYGAALFEFSTTDKNFQVEADQHALSDSDTIRKDTHQSVEHQALAELTKVLADSKQATQALSAGRQYSVTTPHPVKLPSLDLPKFDGTITKFREFWDMFSASVDSSPALDDVQKFAYLKGCLRGAALDAVSGLAVTSSNYGVAVQLVKERFGNQQQIISAHYTALMHAPAALNNVTSLRRFHDTVEKHLRSLEASGQDTSQDVFIPMIMHKLPKEALFQLEILKSDPQSPWSLGGLRDAITRYVKAMETTELAATIAKKPEAVQPPAPAVSTPTVASLVTATKASSPKCFFCKSDHFSDECPKYTTVEARQQQLADCCFICFRKGHWASECQSRRPCYHCRRTTHHRSLCTHQFPSQPKLNAQAAKFKPRVQSPPSQVAAAVDHRPTTQSATTVNLQSKGVNLPTATATVGGSMGMTDCNVLFDTGSSRTFITQRLADVIQPDIIGEDVLSIASFGARSRRTMTLPRVRFNLMCRDGSVQDITANVMQWICCPVIKSPISLGPNSPVTEDQLATSIADTTESVDVDFLIGTDYYFNIMGTERVQVSEGLVLLDSKLGYIPAGRTESDAFDLQRFWKLEEIGVHDDAYSMKTPDDVALDHFQQSLQYVNGRYVVSWPWQDDHLTQPDLPQNFDLAFGRLKSLLRRIQRTPEVVTKYHATIQDQLQAGIIEEVLPETTFLIIA